MYDNLFVWFSIFIFRSSVHSGYCCCCCCFFNSLHSLVCWFLSKREIVIFVLYIYFLFVSVVDIVILVCLRHATQHYKTLLVCFVIFFFRCSIIWCSCCLLFLIAPLIVYTIFWFDYGHRERERNRNTKFWILSLTLLLLFCSPSFFSLFYLYYIFRFELKYTLRYFFSNRKR